MKAIIYIAAIVTFLYAIYTLNDLFSIELLSAFLFGGFLGTLYALMVNMSDKSLEGALSPHTALLVVIGVAMTLVIAALSQAVEIDAVRSLFVIFAGIGTPMWAEYEWRHGEVKEALLNRRINKDMS